MKKGIENNLCKRLSQTIKTLAVVLLLLFVSFSIGLSINKTSTNESINQQGEYNVKIVEKSDFHCIKMFCDPAGNKVLQPLGNYGLLYEYDQWNNPVSCSYLDVNGNIMQNSSGYSTEVRKYDAFGRKISEVYFDIQGNPVTIDDGRFETRYNYYPNGGLFEISLYDINGKRIDNNVGYSIVRRTYYSNGDLKLELYFDHDGNPVALSKGQYGIKYVGDKTFYLNKDGKVYFLLENFISNFPWMVFILGILLSLTTSLLPGKPKRILLALYIVFILYETIAFRESGGINLTPLWSYKQFFSNYNLRLEILNNIWLFVPFGAGLYSLTKKKWIVIIPLVFSIFIEVSQYIFGLGLCEIDDVISNTLGGIIGIMMAVSLLDIRVWWNSRKSVVNG